MMNAYKIMISLTINGENHTINAPVTLTALLASLELDPARIAVECDLQIVPKSEFGTKMMEDGNIIEIVHFIGGG